MAVRALGSGMVVALLVFGTTVGQPLHGQPSASRPRAVPGEYLVKFRAGTGEADRARARGRIGAARVGAVAGGPRGGEAPVELVRAPAAYAARTVVAQLETDPAVEYVEPNWIYTHAARPNDPSFALQWALENTGQTVAGYPGTAGADISLLAAWQMAPDARTVYVGVLDEGIDFAHPDLGVQPGGAIWTNPFDPADGLDNDGNGYVDDVHGWDFAGGDNSIYDGSSADPGLDAHGTHVAGTIGAKTGNGLGVAGVSPGVVIIPAKFLGVYGGTTAHAVMALDYFTDLKVRHGLNIVATSHSWGGGGYSQALLEAIARAAREDILFVAAAGNGGSDNVGDDTDRVPYYPAGYNTTGLAGYDAVISVTATGQSDDLIGWANFGQTSVDLAAPGSLVLSTTPQRGYSYSSGTSMAVPHVTGTLALVHRARGLSGFALREAVLRSVDPIAGLSGRSVTGGRLNAARSVGGGTAGGGGSSPDQADIVLYASQATTVVGDWAVQADSTAATGARLQSTDRGAAKISTALGSPAHYFELTFEAERDRPYRLWIRGRAGSNYWGNDSVHVQFDGTVNASGTAVHRIGTTSSTVVNLEDCSGCGLSGWGWQDNGYGAGVLGPLVQFAASGRQRLRVQIREDGIGIDQIVLSSSRYLTAAPGALKHDATILGPDGTPATGSPGPGADEIVLYAADAAIAGAWTRTADGSAADGILLQNPNAGAAKVKTALAAPADYVELTFQADAGRSYRLWIRGRAQGNSWANDSVHVQFDRSVTAAGAPVYRIGTSSAAAVNLEECAGCGLSGWGWQDNGYGAGVLGPSIRFATAGTQRVRIQVREDGFGIDQIVLSAVRYLNAAPGTPKGDSTILVRR